MIGAKSIVGIVSIVDTLKHFKTKKSTIQSECKRIDHNHIRFANPCFIGHACGRNLSHCCSDFEPSSGLPWLYNHWDKIDIMLSNEEVTIPEGEKIIIGADKLAHHISSGMISPIGEASTVEGHNAEGIAKYICLFLRSHLAFDLDEMLEGYDLTMNDLAYEIQYALEEIGFYK